MSNLQSTRAMRGIINTQGTSCHTSSALQLLFHCFPTLREALLALARASADAIHFRRESDSASVAVAVNDVTNSYFSSTTLGQESQSQEWNHHLKKKLGKESLGKEFAYQLAWFFHLLAFAEDISPHAFSVELSETASNSAPENDAGANIKESNALTAVTPGKLDEYQNAVSSSSLVSSCSKDSNGSKGSRGRGNKKIKKKISKKKSKRSVKKSSSRGVGSFPKDLNPVQRQALIEFMSVAGDDSSIRGLDNRSVSSIGNKRGSSSTSDTSSMSVSGSIGTSGLVSVASGRSISSSASSKIISEWSSLKQEKWEKLVDSMREEMRRQEKNKIQFGEALDRVMVTRELEREAEETIKKGKRNLNTNTAEIHSAADESGAAEGGILGGGRGGSAVADLTSTEAVDPTPFYQTLKSLSTFGSNNYSKSKTNSKTLTHDPQHSNGPNSSILRQSNQKIFIDTNSVGDAATVFRCLVTALESSVNREIYRLNQFMEWLVEEEHKNCHHDVSIDFVQITSKGDHKNHSGSNNHNEGHSHSLEILRKNLQHLHPVQVALQSIQHAMQYHYSGKLLSRIVGTCTTTTITAAEESDLTKNTAVAGAAAFTTISNKAGGRAVAANSTNSSAGNITATKKRVVTRRRTKKNTNDTNGTKNGAKGIERPIPVPFSIPVLRQESAGNTGNTIEKSNTSGRKSFENLNEEICKQQDKNKREIRIGENGGKHEYHPGLIDALRSVTIEPPPIRGYDWSGMMKRGEVVEETVGDENFLILDNEQSDEADPMNDQNNNASIGDKLGPLKVRDTPPCVEPSNEPRARETSDASKAKSAIQSTISEYEVSANRDTKIGFANNVSTSGKNHCSELDTLSSGSSSRSSRKLVGPEKNKCYAAAVAALVSSPRSYTSSRNSRRVLKRTNGPSGSLGSSGRFQRSKAGSGLAVGARNAVASEAVETVDDKNSQIEHLDSQVGKVIGIAPTAPGGDQGFENLISGKSLNPCLETPSFTGTLGTLTGIEVGTNRGAGGLGMVEATPNSRTLSYMPSPPMAVEHSPLSNAIIESSPLADVVDTTKSSSGLEVDVPFGIEILGSPRSLEADKAVSRECGNEAAFGAEENEGTITMDYSTSHLFNHSDVYSSGSSKEGFLSSNSNKDSDSEEESSVDSHVSSVDSDDTTDDDIDLDSDDDEKAGGKKGKYRYGSDGKSSTTHSSAIETPSDLDEASLGSFTDDSLDEMEFQQQVAIQMVHTGTERNQLNGVPTIQMLDVDENEFESDLRAANENSYAQSSTPRTTNVGHQENDDPAIDIQTSGSKDTNESRSGLPVTAENSSTGKKRFVASCSAVAESVNSSSSSSSSDDSRCISSYDSDESSDLSISSSSESESGSGSNTSSDDSSSSQEELGPTSVSSSTARNKKEEDLVWITRKETRFTHPLPQNLVFHLKRFEYSPTLGRVEKLGGRIEIPDTLSLDCCCFKEKSGQQNEYEGCKACPTGESKTNQSDSCKLISKDAICHACRVYGVSRYGNRYRLTGAIVHVNPAEDGDEEGATYGVATEGHYVTYIRSRISRANSIAFDLNEPPEDAVVDAPKTILNKAPDDCSKGTKESDEQKEEKYAWFEIDDDFVHSVDYHSTHILTEEDEPFQNEKSQQGSLLDNNQLALQLLSGCNVLTHPKNSTSVTETTVGRTTEKERRYATVVVYSKI